MSDYQPDNNNQNQGWQQQQRPLPPPYFQPGPNPAWEREKTPQSFIDTIKSMVTNPTGFFETLALEGGLLNPWLFAIIIMIPSSIASSFFYSIKPVGTIFSAIFASCISPFIYAGIIHLILMILGGVSKPYEATFRACTYPTGVGSILNLIPFIGPILGGIFMVVMNIIGLTKVHQTDMWRVACAVLLPIVVAACCVFGVMAIFMTAVISSH